MRPLTHFNRLICQAITLLTVLLIIPASHAQDMPKDSEYKVPNLESMVDFMFSNGYMDPNDPQQLIDYVRVKDCALFQKHYRDDFTWNKIKTRIVNESKTLQTDVATHFVFPDTLKIDRYNFQTKAFDINKYNQMRNINIMNVLDSSNQDVCDRDRYMYGEQTLATRFDIKFSRPLSLYRIPMAEAMARYILPEISQVTESGTPQRNFYMLIYFTMDGVIATEKTKVLFGGHIDKIEFFLDPEHTQRVKRLVYSDL